MRTKLFHTIGSAHLETLDEARRSEIAPWLLPMVKANLRMWRETPRPYPADPDEHRHGAPPAAAVERALLGAISELMIPGFERFGLPTAALAAWLAEGAPTE